jgi:hypothetical protein
MIVRLLGKKLNYECKNKKKEKNRFRVINNNIKLK